MMLVCDPQTQKIVKSTVERIGLCRKQISRLQEQISKTPESSREWAELHDQLEMNTRQLHMEQEFLVMGVRKLFGIKEPVHAS